MREFVVIGHEAPVTADFSLDALASEAGRLDVLCRCVGAGLFLSHGIRESTAVSLVLRDRVTVRFEGSSLRNARPDERTLAGLVRTALAELDRAVGHQIVEAAPGVSVSSRGFDAVQETENRLVWLHVSGDPIVDVSPPADSTFVLSDHREFTPAERETLETATDTRVRLGPEPIHADHAVSVVHNYLDTGGYAAY